MKWTISTASGFSFADVGDMFSANGAGGQPHIDATCQNPANTVLWESAWVQEIANGYSGKMVNGFEFKIVFAGTNVTCELEDRSPGRQDSSGTWSGDDAVP